MSHVATRTKQLVSTDLFRDRAIRFGRARPLLVAAALAGCAAAQEPGPAPAETPDLRSRQERACAAATADHIGQGLEAVTPTWRGTTGRGTAEVEVRDGERLHVCEIDASARPLRLLHPQA